MGLEPGEAPEAWLFEQPDEIRALHRGYVEAGSDLLLTCTFGGTRYRLEGHGLADRVVEVNRRAAELARDEARLARRSSSPATWGRRANCSPRWARSRPKRWPTPTPSRPPGLVEGGADFLLIETMSDLGEARAAIEGARRVTDLPIVCTFSFDTHGRTMMGLTPGTGRPRDRPAGRGRGRQLRPGPGRVSPTFLQAMRQAAPDAILWAKPNAGLPRLVGEQVVYDATPEHMGQIALQLREAGAQVIGGCCGTTPAHIAAMAAACSQAMQLEQELDTLSLQLDARRKNDR